MHASGCVVTETTRLMFLEKAGEPPGHPEHNIGYDHIVVDVCDACNGATVEKLHHDCFDFEDVWDQYEWYELTPDDGTRMRTIATTCPRPLDPACGCDVHVALRDSARALPASTWQAGFEWDAHHRPIAITDSEPPRFVPDPTRAAPPGAVAAAPTNQQLTEHEWRSLARLMVATFVIALVAYFAFVHWPWFVDVLVVLALVPVSVLASVMMMAVVRTITDR